MTKCNYCEKDVEYLPYNCKYCGMKFCSKHRLPENHDCSFIFSVLEDNKKNRHKLDHKKSKKKKIFLMKSSIFKDESKLDIDFIPTELPHRYKELSLLTQLFLTVLNKKYVVSRKILITGQKGIGKTATVRLFGKMLTKASKDRQISLKQIYINCREESSSRKILIEITQALIDKSTDLEDSSQDILKTITNYLDDQDKKLLVVLDGLDNIVQNNKEVIQLFTRLSDNSLNTTQRVSIIGILRDTSCIDKLDINTLRTLGRNIIKFNNYESEQIFDILKHRTEISLKENTISDELIKMISDIVFTKGDIKYGLNLIRKSGKIAEKKGLKSINDECIKSYLNSNKKNRHKLDHSKKKKIKKQIEKKESKDIFVDKLKSEVKIAKDLIKQDLEMLNTYSEQNFEHLSRKIEKTNSGLYLKNIIEYLREKDIQEYVSLQKKAIRKLEDSTGIVFDELLFLFNLDVKKYYYISHYLISEISKIKELYRTRSFEEIITNLKILNIPIEYISNQDLIDVMGESDIAIQDHHIKFLCINHGGLKVLPENIGNLSQLEYLDLRNNKLKSIPKSIGKLTQLKNLDLSGNDISNLPESLSNLPLTYLNLARNHNLKVLPEVILQISKKKIAKKFIKRGVHREDAYILAVLEIFYGRSLIRDEYSHENVEEIEIIKINDKGYVTKLFLERVPSSKIFKEYQSKLKHCNIEYWEI